MRKIVPLLLLAVALASCMQINTMYNARKYFNAAQARPLNANGRPNNQAVEEYTKAIKKCGIILSNETRDSRTDDALFLMARALYYKGNSSFQAKDQFESLIQGFPESNFYSEAHIYLARVLRDINRKEEAFKVLQEFILDPQHQKLHPRGLLTLAEFNIADKDYLQAQYWLGKIITEYPQSNEYREAFFIYGQNYFIQRNYRAALEEFEKIARDRRISQTMKLDARYNVALNQFLLGELEQSYKTIQKLLKDELRPDKLSQARVLQARLFLARGETDKGLAEIEDISKVYPRTLSSAEAQYYLGEYHFYKARDLDKAGAAYTKVRTEFINSELATPGQEKSLAINQMKSRVSFAPESNLQQFVDYQISAAENYFNVFSLPDSALVMYQRIIDSRDSLVTLRDSVEVELEARQGAVDSLAVILAALPEPVKADSLEISADLLEFDPEVADSLVPPDSLWVPEPEPEFQADADSLDISEPGLTDEVDEMANSLLLYEIEPVVKSEPDSLDLPVFDTDFEGVEDSLEVAEIDGLIPAESDSTAVSDQPEAEQAPDLAEQRRRLQQQLTSAEGELARTRDRLQALDTLLQRYDRELVPLALFSQANIHSRTGPDRSRMEEIFARMSERYPDNKYTNALEDMLAGRPVRLIDPEEEAQELLLDRAFGLAETEPDSMLVILSELASSDYTPISLSANYRLGWFYTFEVPDTTAAKPYLNKVLELQRSGEYASVTSRFYDGSKFNLHKFDELVDSLAVADSLAALADTLKTRDEEKPEETEPDIPVDPEIQPNGTEPGNTGEVIPEDVLPEETEDPGSSEPLPEPPAPDEVPPEEPPPGEELPEEGGNGSAPLNPDEPSE